MRALGVVSTTLEPTELTGLVAVQPSSKKNIQISGNKVGELMTFKLVKVVIWSTKRLFLELMQNAPAW